MTAKPIGSELRVDTSTANAPNQPAIAINSFDQFAVVWQSQSQSGSGVDIYERLYRADGAALGQEFRVNQTIEGAQTDPAVAIDKTGGSIVVWSSNSPANSGRNIYGQRISATGRRLGREFLINASIAGNQTAPAVATDLNGDFVVTWTSNGQTNATTKGKDTSGTGIYAQRYTRSGVLVGREFLVNQTTSGNQQNAAIAVNSQGNYVIAWESNQPGSGKDIVAQRYRSNGTRIGLEFQINRTTVGNQSRPTVGISASGDFTIAWESDDSGGRGIAAQRYSFDGTPRGRELRVNSTTVGNQITPSIGMDAEGGFSVAWATEGGGIAAQQYDLSGKRSGGELQVSNQPINQGEPTLGTAANGNFVMSWLSSQGSSQIKAQRYRVGRSLLPPGMIQGTREADILRGTLGNDKIYGYAGNDKIYGYLSQSRTGGDDLMDGGVGNDWLFGGRGNDVLLGGEGRDLLNAGAGANLLYGGSGRDSLTGGRGADTFAIGQASGTDLIINFQQGIDRMGLLENLQFSDLTLQQRGSRTWISVGLDPIATLNNTIAATITAADFTSIRL